MNLILIPVDAVTDGVAKLGPIASEHVRKVLKKGVGSDLRIGVENGDIYRAVLTSIGENCTAHLAERVGARRNSGVHLLVAVPRPKAVSRLVQTAASFGIESLTFVDGWKVDKSYFDSPRLHSERLREDAVAGAEQGAHTLIPELFVERGFRRYIEDVLPERFSRITDRYYFDPGATQTQLDLRSPEGERLLAFGPEGGFIPAELASLGRAGFRGLRLNTPILTTEIAVAAALGQLALAPLMPQSR